MHGFFLVGPTAVGKSAVAESIAQDLGYDILSADSMLVYKGMDIGTAKPSKDSRAHVRYFGIDIESPDKPFSAGEYYRYACDVLSGAIDRNREVIIAGGTGLYIKSLTHGLTATPPRIAERRSYWSNVFREGGLKALQDALREISPEFLESLQDKMNHRRLIRALEMAEDGIAKTPDTWKSAGKGTGSSHEAFGVGNRKSGKIIGLMMPADMLALRIKDRVEKMFSCGFEDEVRNLLKQYGNLSETARQAIGYAEVIDFIRGKCSLRVAMDKTVIRTRQLAKKQGTWFRHQADVEWIHVDPAMKTEDISRLVLDCWRKYGPTNVIVNR